MKREASEGFITKAGIALCLALISGCAAQQQREVNAAYISAQQEKAKALIACATRPNQVAECGLMVAAVYGGGGNDVVPVVRSDLDVVMNSSVAGVGLNVLGNIRQSDNARDVALAQTDASVRIAESGDARQVETLRAATGSNAAIAGTLGAVASVGLTQLGSAAQSANNTSASNVSALTGMVAALPATTQITAGRDVIQARDVDQSATGGDRVSGDGNRLRNSVDCVAMGGTGAPAGGGSVAATGGATSPISATYNPLISGGDGASGANNCGGG